jgi:hypothetical protein
MPFVMKRSCVRVALLQYDGCSYKNRRDKDTQRKSVMRPQKQRLHWRLTPVIPATREADIRRTVVRSQPGQIVQETLSQKTPHKKGLVEWLKV